MASPADWIEGARLRTLPAALAPIFAGSAIALLYDSFIFSRAVLAAVVALALQIGVNYANDYSDGIRGTDDVRTGPARLTAGKKTAPGRVKAAAMACFGIGALAGLALVALSGQWWLLAAGAAAIVAAWYYTGGENPYGYRGLGEVFVLIFFGYMATVGTTYTQLGHAPLEAWLVATGIGLLACAILMANNIRDIPTDAEVGKHTLAVRLGTRRARIAYVVMLFVALLALVPLALNIKEIWGVIAILIPVLLLLAKRIGAEGRELIAVLKYTGFAELAYGVGVFVAIASHIRLR